MTSRATGMITILSRKILNGRPLQQRPSPGNLHEGSQGRLPSSTKQCPAHQTCDNLTSTERKALLSLRSRSNIVIKPVDKGSATVVMSRQDYLDRVMSHLQNEEYYLKLDEEPTSRYAQEITCLLTEMTDRQVIDKETFKYLRPQDPRTSQFYILPKIHKEGNPGRPTASSCRPPRKEYLDLQTITYVRWSSRGSPHISKTLQISY